MEKRNRLDSEGYEEMEMALPFQVKTVRSKLEDKYQLIIPQQCDEFISRCLRSKDGNIEKAVVLILSFRTALEQMQLWAVEIKPSYYGDFYKTTAIIPLIKRALGRRLFVFCAEAWDPEMLSFDEIFMCVWMMGQFLNAESVDTQRKGSVTILDFSKFTMKQFMAVNHWKIVSLSKWAHNGVMGRLKSFHIVNHVRIVSMLYNGIKPFMKEKIRKRIHFHNNLKDLFKHFDVGSLPKFLGGEMDLEECIDKQLVHDFLKSDEYFNEMLRNGIPNK